MLSSLPYSHLATVAAIAVVVTSAFIATIATAISAIATTTIIIGVLWLSFIDGQSTPLKFCAI